MAKKSFKEKEQAYLSKNKVDNTDTPSAGYIPQKTEREKALDLLSSRGFKVSINSGVLYCECENEEEYNRYRSILLEHFNRGGRVAFSFGGSIKNPDLELE